MSPFAEPEPNTRMKKHLSHFRLVLALASLLALRLSGFAAVLVDGTWADGTRTNTSYPTDAAWYTSGGAALMTAYTNMLSVTNNLNGTSSSQWYTYFTAQGSPVHLGVGDTLTITLAFKVDGVGAQNSSKNFRLGVYDSSGGSRTTSDASIAGANYTGYAFFSNFGVRGGSGLQHWKRTTLTSSDPLSTSGDSTGLGTGGNTTGTQAFTNGGSYTLSLRYARTNETAMEITATYSGGGLTNVWTVADTGAVGGAINTNFDTLEIRPSGGTTTATNFIFTEFKVEGPSGSALAPFIISEPTDLTRVVGTLAQFTVGAGGSALHYKWYYSNVTV